ncbi:MAG TPA: tetratricopeptide repeat protein, partial [Kofleriaceae bacterium]|nr:tetratricopeptide repeat protein [Kofleriaceae bacterium]
KARWKLVEGKLLEGQDQADAAVESYVEAAKLAGDLDLAPRMAAVTTLMGMSHKAALARDPHRASMLASRADSILGNLPELAQSDPTVAMTLGVAYLEADNAQRAEPWLRHASEARPDDLGALFQLAKALAKLDRVDEAIAQLKKAREKDPDRGDIALELARTYEAAHRDDAAGAIYVKLLASKDVSIEARGWAGRYYVRRGDVAKGAEQGEEIRQVDPSNAAGLYLRGEGQLAQGAVEPASKAFKRATELDPDPAYFDAWGRAAEAQAIQTKDTRFEDVAIRAYQSAHDGAARMLNPLAGLGRIYLGRHDPSRAVPPLLEAAKLKPDDPDIAYDIGSAYQDLQQNPTAIKWLELSGREKQRAETFWRLGQLYYDGSHDKDAARNLALATRLGNQEETDTGKTIEWLTEALYQYGSIALALHKPEIAREAYKQYIGRHPKNAAQLREVTYKLATELRH